MNEFEQAQLELDRERFQGEQKVKELELEIRRQELELKQEEIRSARWRSPVLVGIIAALIGFLGNIYATIQQGRNAQLLEEQKYVSSIRSEKEKLQSNLILEAIKTGDPDTAARNLKFLVAVGFLDDESERITAYIAEKEQIPVLPTSDISNRVTGGNIGSQEFERIDSLSIDSPIRKSSLAVGLLEFVTNDSIVGFCSAFLVARSKIVTANYCINSSYINNTKVQLRLGYLSETKRGKTFNVKPQPLKANEDVGYVVLEVEGNPGVEFGVAKLSDNPPEPNTKIYMIHHGGGKELLVSRGRDCIVANQKANTPASFIHYCDSTAGAGGAPLFSAISGQVVGFEHSGSSQGNVGKHVPQSGT